MMHVGHGGAHYEALTLGFAWNRGADAQWQEREGRLAQVRSLIGSRKGKILILIEQFCNRSGSIGNHRQASIQIGSLSSRVNNNGVGTSAHMACKSATHIVYPIDVLVRT